jgi:hypothetical protein
MSNPTVPNATPTVNSKSITREPDETSASFAARRAANKMTTPDLVKRVKTTFAKIRSELPYIVELRARFEAKPRGAAHIDGCLSWQEFCVKRLHRTDRHIRRVLAENETEISVGVSVEKVPERETHIITVKQDAATPAALAVRDGHISVNDAAATYGVPSEEINKKLSRGGGLSAVVSDDGAKHYDRRNDEYRDEYTDADADEKEPEAEPATRETDERETDEDTLVKFKTKIHQQLSQVIKIGLANGIRAVELVEMLRSMADKLDFAQVQTPVFPLKQEPELSVAIKSTSPEEDE